MSTTTAATTPPTLTPEQIATAKTFLSHFRDYSYTLWARRALSKAALDICLDLESRAPEGELWSAAVRAEDLTDSHRLGEHLSATRRHFGLIP